MLTDRVSSKINLGSFGSTRMTIEIGQVEAIFRYRVKSMAGERVEVANMGWHGIEGDRRLAFRRRRSEAAFLGLLQASCPICFGLLPSGMKTASKGTFLRTSGRRKATSWRSSEKNWPRRSSVATELPSR